jgi:predicted flap endonuclease-1-like 5' DNA nuclease
MFLKFDVFASEDNETQSWWWLGLKVGIITALITWLVVIWQTKKRTQTSLSTVTSNQSEIPLPVEGGTEPETSVADSVDEVPAPPAESQPPAAPDNFRKIEGIGPKTESILHDSGILTYEQLANTQPVDIKQLLVEAGLTLGDPTTWPEQAALAALGEWDELQRLQATLKGGRRV